MNKPKVVVFQSASVDGKLTLAPDVLLLRGDERWQAVAGSDQEAYQAVKSLFKPQAILEGSGSVVLEGEASPPLEAARPVDESLYQDFLPEAVVHPDGPRYWFTVVDSRGRVRWIYKEFPGEEWQGWYLLVLVARQTPPEYLAYLQAENIPYLVCGDRQVDLAGALEKMQDRLGVTCLVSTAGSRLNGALLRAGLVDEVNIEFFPAIIGGSETPALFGGPALLPDQVPAKLRLIAAQVRADGKIWLRYQVAANTAG